MANPKRVVSFPAGKAPPQAGRDARWPITTDDWMPLARQLHAEFGAFPERVQLKPCQHLDHDAAKHGDCTLKAGVPDFPDVKYWERAPMWAKGGWPRCIQFCGADRGRIDHALACYDGSMPCYDARRVSEEK